MAVLQGLDKITARVSTIDAPIDMACASARLVITARACVKHPPEEPPETAAFLQIDEVRQSEGSEPRSNRSASSAAGCSPRARRSRRWRTRSTMSACSTARATTTAAPASGSTRKIEPAPRARASSAAVILAARGISIAPNRWRWLGHELRVEEAEAAEPQPRDEMGERHLARVGDAAEHALAEERARPASRRRARPPAAPDRSTSTLWAWPAEAARDRAGAISSLIQVFGRSAVASAQPLDDRGEMRCRSAPRIRRGAASGAGGAADGSARAAARRAARDRPRTAHYPPAILGHREDAGGIGAEQQRRGSARSSPPLSRATPRILEPVDVVVAIDEIGLGDEPLMQRDRGLDAGDDEFLERPAQPHQAFVAAGAVDDELGDQAVVIRRHDVALIERAIDAHAEAARRVVAW